VLERLAMMERMRIMGNESNKALDYPIAIG
jgi:hypothetical protein